MRYVVRKQNWLQDYHTDRYTSSYSLEELNRSENLASEGQKQCNPYRGMSDPALVIRRPGLLANDIHCSAYFKYQQLTNNFMY